MRSLLALAFACAATGCYSPKPPSGGYECGADGACPDGLACECGVCVKSADDAACSFTVEIDESTCSDHDKTTGRCVVVENLPFTVKLTALKQDMSRSHYSGTARLDSTWGHARVRAPFTFVDGQADPQVLLDRATPGRTVAVLSASIGTAVGVSPQSVIVDPPTLVPENQPVLDTKNNWASAAIGLPSVDRGPGGYTLYYAGTEGMNKTTKIGVATSGDGKQWSVAAQPLLGDSQYNYLFPSVLRLSDSDVRLFSSRTAAAETTKSSDLVVAASTDGGKIFGMPTVTLATTQCKLCAMPQSGILFPSVVLDPRVRGGWLVYFLAADGVNPDGTLATARSQDQGMTWSIDPVPTPSTGDNEKVFPYSASVVYDARDKLFRMWYGRVTNAFDVCAVEISYATSEDGLFFTGSRRPVELFHDQVAWAPAHNPYPANLIPVDGLLPGAIELHDENPEARFVTWFTVVAHIQLSNVCIPVAIGRATRP